MKSRSSSRIEAKEHLFRSKTVIENKLLFTGNGLWPVFTDTELHINQKMILKISKILKMIKNRIYFWKQIFSNVIKTVRLQQAAMD